jgi:bacterioferritin-associated ferredoxin
VIVCHCRAVNHTTVLDTIDAGARCVDEVAAQCGAGSVCGGCRPTVASFLADDEMVTAAPLRRGPRVPRALRTSA